MVDVNLSISVVEHCLLGSCGSGKIGSDSYNEYLIDVRKKRVGFYYRSKLRSSKCQCPLWTMVDLIKFLRAGQASAPLLDEVLLVLSNWYKRGHFGY